MTTHQLSSVLDRFMHHFLYLFLFLGTVFALSGSVVNTAHAVPVVGFNAGRIIDDSVFTNNTSMSPGQIQSFLNGKVPTCDTQGTQPSEFGGGTRAQWGTARGTPPPYICLKDYAEGGKSSAQIIYDVAQEFQINPQVLIVLLQKEQGLVTDTWPLPIQYRSATGYGCPDTAACDSQYYGLTNQIRWSGRMFRAIMNNSPTWYTPYILGNNFIRWSPNSACGGSTVNIQNRSTQALYNYTPYQPNQSALNAGYGLGDSCGAYGNRNFYLYFTDWFGSTQTTIPYAWRLISQEAHLDSNRTNKFTDDISIAPGQTAFIRLKVQNMGYRVWGSTVRLGASKPQDRSSVFANSTWLGSGRIDKKEADVLSGGLATFEFSVTAPQVAGTYNEYFNIVDDGSTWMNDIGLYYTLKVVPRIQIDNSVSIFAAGQELNIGNHLLSPEKQSILILQNDGNLVLYSDFKPRWSSNTPGSTNATKLVMQNDGNLVLYSQGDRPLWESGTQGNAGAYMTLQTDGNLVVYSQSGIALWNTSSASTPDYLGRVSESLPTSNFYPGQFLQTTDRKYKFILQLDGNLVLYSQNRAVWASTTSGKVVSHAAMQADGNLVVYSNTGIPLWNSGTSGRGPSSTVVQPDGNLVIYNNSGAIWASNTQGL